MKPDIQIAGRVVAVLTPAILFVSCHVDQPTITPVLPDPTPTATATIRPAPTDTATALILPTATGLPTRPPTLTPPPTPDTLAIYRQLNRARQGDKLSIVQPPITIVRKLGDRFPGGPYFYAIMNVARPNGQQSLSVIIDNAGCLISDPRLRQYLEDTGDGQWTPMQLPDQILVSVRSAPRSVRLASVNDGREVIPCPYTSTGDVFGPWLSREINGLPEDVGNLSQYAGRLLNQSWRGFLRGLRPTTNP